MLHIKDDFEDVRKPGRTLGTRSTSGAVRQGVDRERRIAVDHGALRFQPLLRDGWGRQGIAYGPLTADEPWAFSVGLLNGHNASQSGHLEQAYAARLATWLRAGGTQRSRERLWRWLRFGQHRLTLRQFAAWLLRDPRIHDEAVLDENLAVGFFPSAVPHAPSEATAGFVMHSSGEDNGELWVRCEGNDLAVLRGVPNVPLLLTVVQANDLALYFASSVDGEVGGRSPHMRPVGLTSCRSHPPVFAGIHQSVLGQIGFRVDSRVYGVRVAHGAELARGFVGDLATDTGWKHLSVAAGVVRLTLDLGDRATPRISFGSEEESYELTLLPERLRLARAVGTNQPLAEEPWARPAAVSVDLLALEDGVHVVVGGVRRLEPVRLHAVTRLRIDSMQPESPGFSLRQVTIVPREVPIPAELQVPLPHVDAGQRVCVEEFFAGEPTELHRLASSAGQPWRKEFGKARVLIEPGVGAKVHDARSLTSRGRTIYTVPWSHRDFADLEIQVMPPGQRQGQGEEGRAGVVFWQDADNYVIVGTWLNDAFGGASISSFYCLGGFEDIYDAVWTNVGRRIQWGTPYRLRVSCDGDRLTAYLDDRAVLHRALSDVHRRVTNLRIQRVGVVANWEWGNDTGSIFKAFVARSRALCVEQPRSTALPAQAPALREALVTAKAGFVSSASRSQEVAAGPSSRTTNRPVESSR